MALRDWLPPIGRRPYHQEMVRFADEVEALIVAGGGVPTSRRINGYALTSDINLSSSDVGAVPTSRTVNGKPLTGNVTLTPADVGAQPVDADLTAIAAVSTQPFGRNLLALADAAAARTAIGAGTSSLVIGTTAGTAKEGNWLPGSTDITDSTTVGRAVLTAASTAAARSAIGAGTSSLVIGTTSTTAKAGNYQPTSANISDSTAVGRSVLTAADAAAARAAIGAGTGSSNLVIGTTAGTAKEGNYQPSSSDITDSTAAGRAVLTAASATTIRTQISAQPLDSDLTSIAALSTQTFGRSLLTMADAAAARAAIGAGTGSSNLVIGTTAGTAKEGNYQPSSSDIADSTATGRSVLTAASAAAARTAIGAGTSSLVIGTTASTAKAGNYQPSSGDITDATATGLSLLTAASAAAARTAIGAGTSSLVIGTTAGTAKEGNWKPAAADITDSTTVGREVLTAADAAAARLVLGVSGGGGGEGVDPADVGYDVIIIAGQSNASGSGMPVLPDVLDPDSPRISQYAGRGTYQGQIIRAVDPLFSAVPDTSGGVGLGMEFARQHLRRVPVNRSVLIVPAAVGGTGLYNGDWSVLGSLYPQAVAMSQAALEAAGPNSRVVAIVWVQGERDAVSLHTRAQYESALDPVLNGFRQHIPGAEDTPIIIGPMVPEWRNAPNGTSLQIHAAHVDTPNRVANSTFIDMPNGYSSDTGGIHFNAAGQRELGRRIAIAISGLPDTPRPATQARSASVNVSWAAAISASAVSGYIVRHRVAGGPTWTESTISTSLSRLISGLTNGLDYEFQVKTRNAVGDSPWSAIIRESPSAYAGAVVTDAPLINYRLNDFKSIDEKGLIPDPFSTVGLQMGLAGIGDGPRSAQFVYQNYSRLRLGSPAVFNSVSALALEAIIRPTAISATTGHFLIVRDDAIGVARDWRFGIRSDGKLEFYKFSGTIVVAVGATTLAANNTYHVAATYNGSTLSVYVNGVLDGSVAGSGALSSTNEIAIGNISGGGAQNYGYNGRMAGVAIYNKTLSAARILAHAQAAGVA